MKSRKQGRNVGPLTDHTLLAVLAGMVMGVHHVYQGHGTPWTVLLGLGYLIRRVGIEKHRGSKYFM